ncbi:MAG: hypothetical protein AAGA86_04795 [Bacteroidota bacterium]
MRFKKKVGFLLLNALFWIVALFMVRQGFDKVLGWSLLFGVWAYANSHFKIRVTYWILLIRIVALSLVLTLQL